MADICLYLANPADPATEFRADLRDAAGITTTFQANDLKSLVSPQSPFSKGVVLAGTRQTNKALRHCYRMDIVDVPEVLGVDLAARLVIDGVDVLNGSGVLQVEGFVYNPDGTVDYECDLTGGNFLWVAEASRLKWCDLNHLGSITWDDTLPVNTWDRTGRLGTPYPWDYAGCVFFPVHYGWWRNGSTYISRHDLKPHMYIRWMLTKAFEYMGWTLAGAYTETDRFSSLVHLFTRGKWGVTQDEADSLNGNAVSEDTLRRYSPGGVPVPGALLRFTSNTTNTPNWASDTWTQPITARVEICFTIGAGMTLAQPVDWVFELNGAEVAGTQTSYSAIAGMTMCWTACLAAGDEVKIKIKAGAGADPLFPIYMDISAGAGNILVSAVKTGYPCDGDVVPLCSVIDPALTVLDVIAGVTHLEGLYWKTDAANRTVTPYQPGTGTVAQGAVQDWSGKVDCSTARKVSLNGDSCRNFLIAYKEDSSDALLAKYKEENGIELYSLEQVADELATCQNDNRNPTYAPTWHVNEKKGWNKHTSQTGMTGGGSSFLPMWLSMTKKMLTADDLTSMDREQFISFDFNPRIAVYEGLQDDTDLGWFTPVGWTYDNEDGSGAATQAWYPHAYLMDWWQGTRDGIGYADLEVITQSPDLGPGTRVTAPGQETTAWVFLLEANLRGRVLVATVFLKALEAQELSFSDYLMIVSELTGQARYLLLGVDDWSASTGKGTARLLLG